MRPKAEEMVRCPATGQACIYLVEVDNRTVTLRRWVGGNVKATVCTVECAEKWAKRRGYVATGVSETGSAGTRTAVVIVQHPDQIPGGIKPRG